MYVQSYARGEKRHLVMRGIYIIVCVSAVVKWNGRIKNRDDAGWVAEENKKRRADSVAGIEWCVGTCTFSSFPSLAKAVERWKGYSGVYLGRWDVFHAEPKWELKQRGSPRR